MTDLFEQNSMDRLRKSDGLTKSVQGMPLSKKFREEYERTVDAPGLDYSVKPLTDEEYKEACYALGSGAGADAGTGVGVGAGEKNGFVERFLSDEILASRLRTIESNLASVKSDFPDDLKYCLVVMPCTEMGSALPPEAVELGRYLFLLRVSEDGVTVNFAGHNSRYYDLLPEYIRENCTFEIEWRDNGQIFPDGDEFDAFKGKFVKAYEALKGYFK